MNFTSTNGGLSANGNKTEVKREVVLTKRETEILKLVARGLTTQEAADKLFVSIDTVETHRRNIIQKMEARNTVDAVVRAMRMGMIK